MPNEPTKPMTWEAAWEAIGYNEPHAEGMEHEAGWFQAGFQSRDAEVEQLKADLRTALEHWRYGTELPHPMIAAIRERWGL